VAHIHRKEVNETAGEDCRVGVAYKFEEVKK
jgi:hypothetical protein